jgi:hypothetical protein
VLGFLHPDELLQALTAQQWAEWLEFYALEPWGFPVDDLRHGMWCAVTIAPHLKKGTAPDPGDYMFRRPEPQELTPEQTVAHFRAALGGQTKKKA